MKNNYLQIKIHYGRATDIYKMKEMNFFDARKFFPNYSLEQQIIIYSILGGIPHYLKQFNSDLTIEENIKYNILTKVVFCLMK